MEEKNILGRLRIYFYLSYRIVVNSIGFWALLPIIIILIELSKSKNPNLIFVILGILLIWTYMQIRTTSKANKYLMDSFKELEPSDDLNEGLENLKKLHKLEKILLFSIVLIPFYFFAVVFHWMEVRKLKKIYEIREEKFLQNPNSSI